MIAYLVLPSVQAITRIKPNPINNTSVQFQVTFDEPVAEVDTADFALTATGTLSGASITNGSGATYTVIVAVGAGTLRLDIPASATIADLAGLSVNNLPFTTGESYLIPARIYVPLVQR
ncbi:hypothetical protein [uncultured Chloroflexus sp.]|uniref:hypothetical protein n=1 Tax=uncultured Chloroflexus sp. TaxID=214040 RepID=UPI002601D4C3|nr:hypothetical protein [uncultured Chloroflexus sp.]